MATAATPSPVRGGPCPACGCDPAQQRGIGDALLRIEFSVPGGPGFGGTHSAIRLGYGAAQMA